MKYFDYSASTPIHPEAALVYNTLAKACFGNTSSLHDFGGEAQNMLATSRGELANLLNVQAAGIYFTSGGTESNLLSIISLALANQHKGKHIITTMGEHPSVDSAMEYLKNIGFTVTYLPFSNDGRVDLESLSNAIQTDTILVSVQHINPEIGSIQPIKEIADLLKSHDILFHSDCVQSFGKVDLKPIAEIVDSLTLSSHKVHGPKGVGAAYIHPRHRLVPVFPGLVHENGFRGGTVDVPGIAAFVTAANLSDTSDENSNKYSEYRNHLLERLATIPDVFTIYQSEHQLPQIIGLGVTNIEGQLMMLECNRYGFAISTGSACQVGQQHSSKVMMAMQIDPQQAKEFIRISFGSSTTMESVEELATCIIKIAKTIHEKHLQPIVIK